MNLLNSVKNIPGNQIVILRLDTDLPIENEKINDNGRLIKSIPTIELLLEKNCKVLVVGHRGRPEGMKDDSLSLKPVYLELIELLKKDGGDSISNVFVSDIKDLGQIDEAIKNNQIIFFENLRFWVEEEKGNTSLFDQLRNFNPVFVNDAFAMAHRKSASVMLFKELPAYYGLSFTDEAATIDQILENKNRPLTIVLGGAKKDKLNYLDDLCQKADYVLVGGKLPDLIDKTQIKDNVVVASFSPNGLDISDQSIKDFKKIIESSKVIIWAGAMGFYESPDNRLGTEEIARSIANANAVKIIAGGDTGASIANLGLKDKIDFVCSGGGVMLEYLTKGKLPAWE